MNDQLSGFLGGEVSYLEPFIKNAVVVDVGAHQGAFTLWAVENGARWVHAFEPLPFNLVRLLRNVAPGFPTTLHPVAIGRYDGRCDLHVPYEETSGTFVTPGDKFAVRGWDFLAKKVGSIDILKIDIEGGEYDLFPDADLSSVEHFVVETHAWTVEGEPRQEGVGMRPGTPRRQNAYEELLEWLSLTHDLTIEGDEKGGYVVGKRR